MLYFNTVLNSDVMLQKIHLVNVPLQEWIDAIANGTMNANLDRIFKLEEAGKAHEYLEANKVSTASFVSPAARFIFMLFRGAQQCFKG